MSAATFFRSAPALLCALACAALLAHAPAHAQASDAPATPGDRLRARLLERALQNPAPLPAGVQKLADLPYGSDARQRMDVYLPPADARPAGLRAPVIFMVHGGAWRTGDKAMPKVVENKVARWVARGFVFVSINYRMLPDTPVAQQAYDVAQALAAAQQRAPGWGADPGRFILMGHSAGAHLVSLINAQPAFAQRQGAWPWLGAVSLDSAVLNVPRLMAAPHARLYDEAFGTNPAAWALLSPFHQLVAGAPPYQLVCSTERPDQPCLQAEAMARQAATLGVRAEVLPEPLEHGEINGELGLDSGYTRAVEAFMASLDPLVARLLGR
ncbi:alpha/beta hydrolase [Acidovorax sp. NPDC077693]|uniref:alpha/beta hydrolase n=1 Tax=unclassified Acidovorax TaxID=2684926 RepID=UPI0037C6728D